MVEMVVEDLLALEMLILFLEMADQTLLTLVVQVYGMVAEAVPVLELRELLAQILVDKAETVVLVVPA
jgi:hypothetical protein